MRAALVWAAYCSSLLGEAVQDAQGKFLSLAAEEQAAWEAAVQAILEPATQPAPEVQAEPELPKEPAVEQGAVEAP